MGTFHEPDSPPATIRNKTSMKKLTTFTAVALLICASSAYAGWSAVASTGAIDLKSQNLGETRATVLRFRNGAEGIMTARYNVTNPSDNASPGWTTLELGYHDNDPKVAVTAVLYQVDPCTGGSVPIARVESSDQQGNTCRTASIGAAFDFTNKLYYVLVTVTRVSPDALVSARSLRIY